MKIKNLTILSILSLTLLTGCNDKDNIDENIVVSNHKAVEQKAPHKVTHEVKKEVVAEKKETQQKETAHLDKSFTFNLKTADGKAIDVVVDKEKNWKFGDIKDKVVLLDFFATWCPPCKAEIPHLNNIREKLGKNFEIIGVDIGKRGGGTNTNQHLLDFQDTFGIDYPVVLGGDNGQLFGAVSSLNPQGSIPFMVLFNKKGEYLKYYIGMTAQEILTSDIQQAIKMK